MKRTAIFAAALALVLSLAACGNKDNSGQTNNGQTNGNGTTENGGTTNGSGTTNNGGTTNGGDANGSLPDSNNNVGSGTSSGSGIGTGTDEQNRSQAGDDLRSAADSVGDAVSDMVESGRNALSRVTSANTTFEQMLDSARVYDVENVPAAGQNS